MLKVKVLMGFAFLFWLVSCSANTVDGGGGGGGGSSSSDTNVHSIFSYICDFETSPLGATNGPSNNNSAGAGWYVYTYQFDTPTGSHSFTSPVFVTNDVPMTGEVRSFYMAYALQAPSGGGAAATMEQRVGGWGVNSSGFPTNFVDFSAYQGLHFYAKGSGFCDLIIEIRMSAAANTSTPGWQTNWMEDGCLTQTPLVIGSTWQEFFVLWPTFKAYGWSGTPYTNLNPADINDIKFKVINHSTTLTNGSIFIDLISAYSNY